MTLGRCVTSMSVKQLTLDVLGEVGVGRSSYNDDIVLLVWLGNTDGLGRCLSWWRCLLWSPLGRLRGWWLLGRWGWWKIKTRSKITSLWANELTSKDYVRLLPPLCFCPIFQEFWTKSKTRTRFVLLWNTAHVAARE